MKMTFWSCIFDPAPSARALRCKGAHTSTTVADALRGEGDSHFYNRGADIQSNAPRDGRTIQRDIDAVTEAGFPVTSDMRNGTVFCHFMEGFHHPGTKALNSVVWSGVPEVAHEIRIGLLAPV